MPLFEALHKLPWLLFSTEKILEVRSQSAEIPAIITIGVKFWIETNDEASNGVKVSDTTM